MIRQNGLAGWFCDSGDTLPYLQFDLFTIMCDHTSTELDADGQIVHRLKSFVGELQQQARLANAGITDYDILEQVSVRHLSNGGNRVSQSYAVNGHWSTDCG